MSDILESSLINSCEGPEKLVSEILKIYTDSDKCLPVDMKKVQTIAFESCKQHKNIRLYNDINIWFKLIEREEYPMMFDTKYRKKIIRILASTDTKQPMMWRVGEIFNRIEYLNLGSSDAK